MHAPTLVDDVTKGVASKEFILKEKHLLSADSPAFSN